MSVIIITIDDSTAGDYVPLASAVEALEAVLPYMFDNVLVTSHAGDDDSDLVLQVARQLNWDVEADSDGTLILNTNILGA